MTNEELREKSKQLWKEGWPIRVFQPARSREYPEYPSGGRIYGLFCRGWFAPHRYQVERYEDECRKVTDYNLSEEEREEKDREELLAFIARLERGEVSELEKGISSKSMHEPYEYKD